jgi:hypothetical protein
MQAALLTFTYSSAVYRENLTFRRNIDIAEPEQVRCGSQVNSRM